MKKVSNTERKDFREIAHASGFVWQDAGGQYWDESSAYEFSEPEAMDELAYPADDLYQMCLGVVEDAVNDKQILTQLAIPEDMQDYVVDSWNRGDRELYGRFDFYYGGDGPAKLLEFNADTPTSLYEAASFQWTWLQDQIKAGVIPEGSDQFNHIYESIGEQAIRAFEINKPVYFTSSGGADVPEDYGTVEYLGYAVKEMGFEVEYVAAEHISVAGYDEERKCNILVDGNGQEIHQLFKLLPWEHIFEDDFCQYLPTAGTKLVEPAWKIILSSKGLLPLLWEKFPDHPNLLPSFFAKPEDELKSGYVSKPLYSREGSSIVINVADKLTKSSDEYYDHFPKIHQEFCEPPEFDGYHPTIGIWIAGDDSCGMSIRDDKSLIAGDLALFKPHYLTPNMEK